MEGCAQAASANAARTSVELRRTSPARAAEASAREDRLPLTDDTATLPPFAPSDSEGRNRGVIAAAPTSVTAIHPGLVSGPCRIERCSDAGQPARLVQNP